MPKSFDLEWMHSQFMDTQRDDLKRLADMAAYYVMTAEQRDAMSSEDCAVSLQQPTRFVIKGSFGLGAESCVVLAFWLALRKLKDLSIATLHIGDGIGIGGEGHRQQQHQR